jgi:hypothetical protein
MKAVSLLTVLVLLVLIPAGALAQQAAEENDKDIIYKMRKVRDYDRNLNFWFDKTSPEYINEMGFFIYIGQYDGRKPFLMMKIQDVAETAYMDIQKYEFIIDGKTHVMELESPEDIKKAGQPRAVVAETSGNSKESVETVTPTLFEYYERGLRFSHMEIIRKLLDSKQGAFLTYVGKEESKIEPILPEQKEAINRVLKAYVAMGGNLKRLRK